MNDLWPEGRELAVDFARVFVGWHRRHLLDALDRAEREVIVECRRQMIPESIIQQQLTPFRSAALAEFDRLTAVAHPGGWA